MGPGWVAITIMPSPSSAYGECALHGRVVLAAAAHVAVEGVRASLGSGDRYHPGTTWIHFGINAKLRDGKLMDATAVCVEAVVHIDKLDVRALARCHFDLAGLKAFHAQLDRHSGGGLREPGA